MKQITLFLGIGLLGAMILVVHQTVRLNTIIEKSRHSSLSIRWKDDKIAYGINSPPISNDGIVIGGVKTSAVGDNMMMIEMVINDKVQVGVTKNGDILSYHTLQPGNNLVIDVQ